MSMMFYNCLKLEYINLNNLDENKLSHANDMFFNVPSNVVVCMKEINIQSKISSQIGSRKKCYAIDCTDYQESKQKKLNKNDNDCNEKCDISTQYPYEYNGKCYVDCERAFLYDENNKLRNCKCELEECLFCPQEALNKRLCSKCNTDYYPKENDQLNTGEYIKCYKDPEGFYLDNYLYKKCYYTCKKCNISGNSITHNCLECNDNYPIEIIHTNYKNCHEKCNFFHFFDNDYNYHCTTYFSCPDEYPKLLENQKECTKNENKINDLIIKDEKENMTIVTEIEYSKYLKEYIEKKLTKNYDTTNIDNGQDEFIKMGKMALAI